MTFQPFLSLPPGETSSSDGGGSGSTNTLGAGIAGFVVCSILLTVVIALIVYNVYLWKRRKDQARSAKQRLVRQPSPRWKAYQEANGIGGAGTTRPRRGQDNLGYANSSGSVNIKGSGPPPTASLDDINLSDDEEEHSNGEPRVTYSKNNHGNFPMTNFRQPEKDEFYDPNGYRDNSYEEEGVKIYPNTQNPRNPRSEDPEIQLRPAKLQSSLGQVSPFDSPVKESLENHNIHPNNNNNTGPAIRSLPKGSPSKPPRPMIQRNSGLALLSATDGPGAARTVSLTGMGALECPGLDFGPTTVYHSGGIGYNDY